MQLAKQYKEGKIRQQHRENILKAAEIQFVKAGFKGTSMQSIADEASLPKANIVYYFGSKIDLYREVLASIINRWNSVLDTATVDDDPADILEHYICSKIDLSIQHANASKIFATEIIAGAPNLQEHFRNDLRVWMKERVAVFEGWMAQGKMAKVAPQHLIFMIWSTTQHYADFDTQILTITNRLEYDVDDVKEIKAFLCQMILSGVGLTPSGKGWA